MTPGAQEPARPVWVLTPLDNVGPLRCGMSADEVEEALPGARELSRFQADPFFPEILGIQYGLQSAAPAVFTYFDGVGRLSCVAADAAHGPQVMLDRPELTGGVPAVLEQALPDLPSSPERGVLQYGPLGNPGVNGLGLVLRVQETGLGALTRPVLVGRNWADRCTDDTEGRIPKCEWTGRQWPYPGYPAVWPSEGQEPNWPHGWYPPF
jgi:hypothetical protein